MRPLADGIDTVDEIYTEDGRGQLVVSIEAAVRFFLWPRRAASMALDVSRKLLQITRDSVAGEKICEKNGWIIRLGAVAQHGSERNVGVHGASKAKARCR